MMKVFKFTFLKKYCLIEDNKMPRNIIHDSYFAFLKFVNSSKYQLLIKNEDVIC